MRPTLLCYNLSGERAAKIRFAAMRFSILLRPVAPEEYGRPLGALCGLDGVRPQSKAQQEEPFQEEMLVMAGFPAGLVQQLLQGMRRMKIAPVALKAVLTETNSQWDSYRLYREISAEHEAMIRGAAAVHRE